MNRVSSRIFLLCCSLFGLGCILIPLACAPRYKSHWPMLVFFASSVIISAVTLLAAKDRPDKTQFIKKGLLIALAVYTVAVVGQLGYLNIGAMRNYCHFVPRVERVARWHKASDLSLWGGIAGNWSLSWPGHAIWFFPYSTRTLLLFNCLAFMPFGFAIAAYIQKMLGRIILIIAVGSLITLTELLQPIVGVGYCDLSSIWLRVLGLLLGFAVGLAAASFYRKKTA